jgi:hypothetical protein
MPYTTTTLADLQTLMQQRWDQVVFWTPEEARLALNESLRDWNLLTGRWRRRVTLSTLSGAHDYLLPSTIVYGMRVRVGTATLIPSSTLELDLGRPSWRGETVATGGDVPALPTLWAPISLRQVAIWPATLGGTDDLLVDGVSITPVLVLPADTVDLDEETIDILVDQALHVVAFKEAGPRWRSTLVYFQTFLAAAAEENGVLKQSQAYRRWAGLDRRRDLYPTKDAPNQIAEIIAAVAGGGSAGASDA